MKLPTLGLPDPPPWHDDPRRQYYGCCTTLNCYGGALETLERPTGKWFSVADSYSSNFMDPLPSAHDFAQKFMKPKCKLCCDRYEYRYFKKARASEPIPNVLVCVAGERDPWVWDDSESFHTGHLPSGAYACTATLDSSDTAISRYTHHTVLFNFLKNSVRWTNARRVHIGDTGASQSYWS